MANAPLISERRTAVRMLQTPCLNVEHTGAAASQPVSACGSSSASQEFAAASLSSIRRRSVCFPASPTATADELAAGSEPIRRAFSTTAPASPALPRRPTLVDVNSPDGGPQLSLRSLTIRLDPDTPNHLSVPLALLSLHNGGGIRHSPRSSRASSCAGLPSFKDGSPLCSTSADIVFGSDLGRLGSMLSPERKQYTSGGMSPLALSGTSGRDMLPMSLPNISLDNFAAASPPVTAPASSSSPTRVAPTSCQSEGTAATATGTATADLNPAFTTTSAMRPQIASLPTATSSPTTPRASSGGFSCATAAIAATSSAAALTEGEGSGSSSAAAITVPSHLSSFRPPTPMCREDDLLVSMQVMTSPTRRRSRFASAAECNLMAATAAAVAAEEAASLDPPTHEENLTSVLPRTASAAVGIGMGTGILPESRSRRSLVPMASFTDLVASPAAGGSGGSGGGNGVGGWSGSGAAAGTAGGDQALEVQPAALRSTGAVGGVGGGGLDSSGLRSAGSAVWRTVPQLGTVLEEPSAALTRSELNDAGSPHKCGSGATSRMPISPYSSPAGGRRPRANSICVQTIADVGQSSFPEPSSLSGGPNIDLRTHGTAAAPYDDSLSSFMCSFGPAPGTPVGDRRPAVVHL